MKFILLVYSEPALVDALPPAEFDTRLRACIQKADSMRGEGRLSDSQMLETTAAARSVRVRQGRGTVVDGPFAETKEMLAGFNIIEAADIEEATRMAMEFPWTETGCIEVRPVVDFESVRARVGA